jgi:lysozyme
MVNKQRSAVAVLVLSAAGFAGIVMNESYTDKAVIPIPGDVPTVGFGSTRRDDGAPVQMTDTITPPKAVRRAVRDIGRDEDVLHKCFGNAELFQHEWDAYVDLSYNVGPAAVCRSSIVRKVQAGQYEAACNTILDFRRAAGKDCSVRSNGCYGVWLRRQASAKQCLTGEYPK